MRKFEKVKKEFIMYNQDPDTIKMPVRKTKHAVCYDCYSPIDKDITPGDTELIFTNVKAYCNSDEGFILASTSGLGKKGIILANGIGIIESDYADNESNDGNIGFMLHNIGKSTYHVNSGDKIGQLFFFKFLTVDDEEEITTTRTGGFGSTGMK